MHEKNREEMVKDLKRRGYLKSPEIIGAFRVVPREKFIPPKSKKEAYADRPLPIGQGQTISAPSMIAIMLEVLDVKKGQKVLEIGTGSGYNAALLAEIVGENGEIHTIERLKTVGEVGRKNLEETGYDNVKVIIGDGTRGYKEKAPWNRILVTACAPDVPEPLIKQLEIGGKIAAPVGSHYMYQTLLVVEKIHEDETKTEKHGSCAFVPLVGEFGWNEGKIR